MDQNEDTAPISTHSQPGCLRPSTPTSPRFLGPADSPFGCHPDHSHCILRPPVLPYLVLPVPWLVSLGPTPPCGRPPALPELLPALTFHVGESLSSLDPFTTLFPVLSCQPGHLAPAAPHVRHQQTLNCPSLCLCEAHWEPPRRTFTLQTLGRWYCLGEAFPTPPLPLSAEALCPPAARGCAQAPGSPLTLSHLRLTLLPPLPSEDLGPSVPSKEPGTGEALEKWFLPKGQLVSRRSGFLGLPRAAWAPRLGSCLLSVSSLSAFHTDPFCSLSGIGDWPRPVMETQYPLWETCTPRLPVATAPMPYGSDQ